MRERNLAVVTLDDMRGDSRIECLQVDAGPHEQRLGRRAERRCERERLPGRGRAGRRSSRAASPSSVAGTASGASGSTSDFERTGELEREERVPARLLVDAKQGLTRERTSEPVAQEAMESADAERAEPQPLDTLERRARARASDGCAPSPTRRASSRRTGCRRAVAART